MMWKKHDNPQWPNPLRAHKGHLGKLVRDYVQNTEETRGEAAAYARVLACTVGTPHRWQSRRLAAMVVGLAVALLAGAMVLRHPVVPVSKSKATVASASGARSVTPSAPASSAKALLPGTQKSSVPELPIAKGAVLRLRSVPSALPAGSVDLNGQATAILSAAAAASGRMQNQHAEILLEKGAIELHVLPRAPGHSFFVRAGLYQFTVVGTAFTVSQTGSRLELVVSEGKVAVSRGARQLAMVGAGGKWAVEVTPASALAPSQATPSPAAFAAAPIQAAPSPAAFALAPPQAALSPAPYAPVPMPASPRSAAAPSVAASPAATPAPAKRNCGELAASKRTREALQCYQAQAAQSGLAGETAQYEMARLWRDSLGDPESALAAFKDQRSRFPRGTLRIEADLSIIEILPRLGRHTEVMAETEQFLSAHPKAERRGEIHLLRGNIFREVLHDLHQAEREYALGSELRGQVGDDCQFLRAVCLEALGRLQEARSAYETYLLGGKGAHIKDANDRLLRLRL